MYRLLAIADYNDRYVIPEAHTELADRLMEQQGTCGLDFEGGPGNCGAIAPDPGADIEGFMLTGEEPVDLDIVKMAGGRRREGES
jgi:nitrate reductase beta subunit